MGYEQRLEEQVRASGRRTEERLALWETIVSSFQSSGAEGVQDALVRPIGDIRRRFDALVVKLEDML